MLKVFLLIGLSACLALGNPLSKTDEYDDEYEEEEVCLTSADSEAPNTECVFPFTFKGKTFTQCTTFDYYPQSWCATQVDGRGNYVRGEWGECSSSCTSDNSTFYLSRCLDENNF